MRRRTLPKAVLLATVLSLALTGCGVRGDLELPPSDTPDAAQSETTIQQETTPQDDRSFILDGLLL